MSISHTVEKAVVPRPPKVALNPRRLQNIGPLVALLLMAVVFQAMTGTFFTTANLKSIVEGAAVPTVLAVGISFVILLGAIDLSAQGVIAASSMTLSLLVANNVNGNDFGVWGILAAVAVGLVFGAISGALHVFVRTPSLIVTLGMWFVGLGVAAVLFPERVPSMTEPLVLNISRIRLLDLSVVVYIAIAVVVSGYLVLRYTTLGRMIYAIGGDEAVVVASGIPLRRYKFAAFMISGGLAAVAGILLSAQLGNGNADIGNGQLFPAISAAVVGGTLLSGGRGGPLQTALGAVLLEVLNNGLIQIGAGPYSRNIISGAVILIAVAASSWHLRRKLRIVK